LSAERRRPRLWTPGGVAALDAGRRRAITRAMANEEHELRVERDSLGEVRVPADRYWGAQTERSRQNFPIGHELMPREVVHALALVKKACARANAEIGALPREKAALIERVCDEILSGSLDAEFPLRVWQTGSGTHSNMNVNEVVVNRAHVVGGGRLGDPHRALHPNDDVNKSQSSNDVFPTAMNIAALRLLESETLPKLRQLRDALARKADEFMPIIKIGRTHMMDATPLSLGHEFSGYAAQLEQRIVALEQSTRRLGSLALGGTAVGTGINTPPGFAARAIAIIAELTGLNFQEAPNHFSAQAAHDDLVEVSGQLRATAVSLAKIAGDIRLLSSGPRAGLAELVLRASEPGSSIMPGKTNPTQVEALTMVCVQVMGNDLAVAMAGSSGQLELNAYKPVLIYNVLMAARNLGDASSSFAERAVSTLEADPAVIARHLERSLMLVTALNPHIGYEKAAKIAQKAHREGSTLREAALELGWVSADQFDAWVDPLSMLGPSGPSRKS
jgi:fumarate hydratase, class II